MTLVERITAVVERVRDAINALNGRITALEGRSDAPSPDADRALFGLVGLSELYDQTTV